MNKRLHLRAWTWVFSWVVVFFASHAMAIEIRFLSKDAKPGETVDIPMTVDRVDNLAGIKLVIQYDQKVLHFIQATKTQHSSSLMHVVNDKKPGILIVVMAGARGIAGSDMPLLMFRFRIDPGAAPATQTSLNVTEVQMMSDQLKELHHSVLIEPIIISENGNFDLPALRAADPPGRITTDSSPASSILVITHKSKAATPENPLDFHLKDNRL